MTVFPTILETSDIENTDMLAESLIDRTGTSSSNQINTNTSKNTHNSIIYNRRRTAFAWNHFTAILENTMEDYILISSGYDSGLVSFK